MRRSSVHDARYLQVIARIRSARKAAGFSQADLATRLGKPQSFVSKVETCERRLDLIEAIDFCRALEVNLSGLLPRELRRALGMSDPAGRRMRGRNGR
jgi:transcriptional regulator with XRE-family HTH domain